MKILGTSEARVLPVLKVQTSQCRETDKCEQSRERWFVIGNMCIAFIVHQATHTHAYIHVRIHIDPYIHTTLTSTNTYTFMHMDAHTCP